MANHAGKKEGAVLWALPEKQLMEYLSGSKSGLTDAEAKKRQSVYGANEIEATEKRNAFTILLSQLKSPIIIILVIAAFISSMLKENTEAVVILCIIFLNAVLGFIQEYKAEKTLKDLKKYITIKTKVKRNNETIEIDAKNLVPGDIVYLDIGDIIPADIRLLEVDEIATDESSLTGESMPVIKTVTRVSKSHSLPQYLHNIAFMGTAVSAGRGYGIVIATGEDTFFGKTASAISKVKTESDFEKNIRKFSALVFWVIIGITGFILAVNILLGRGVLSSFIFALALAVGITPEILPIITTIALSKGAMKMAKEKVITKRLSAIEDLGNMDTLCCDKTGTLTEGRFSLIDYHNLDSKRDDKLLLYGLLCNSAKKGRNKGVIGDAIDSAILGHRMSRHMEKELSGYKIVDFNEFDFSRKRMSVVAKTKKGNIMIVKGAPESMLQVSRFAVLKGRRVSLTKRSIAKLKAGVAAYETRGYNVICIAEKKTRKTDTMRTDEKGLCILGFLLFHDPPKSTVREALKKFQQLGVRVKVVSGDSAIITRQVCCEVGLKLVENRIIGGGELDKLSANEFEEYCMRYNVFARITPEQKYRIVTALNKEGNIVGFLGDGINDAPALKAADVGISVDSAAGIAKDSADIILMKKSLRSVCHGISEGRKTFGNITKYILNTISANYGNMFTVAASSMFLGFIPMLPSQILLNNFITDAPHVTIAGDNVDDDLLKKPRRWDMKYISKFMVVFGLISTFFDLALIIPLILIFKADIALFRTAWFVESSLSEIISTFAIRTKLPFWKSRPYILLTGLSIIAFVIAIWITYTVFGSTYFDFVNMQQNILLLIAAVLVGYFITLEIAKRLFFRKFTEQ